MFFLFWVSQLPIRAIAFSAKSRKLAAGGDAGVVEVQCGTTVGRGRGRGSGGGRGAEGGGRLSDMFSCIVHTST